MNAFAILYGVPVWGFAVLWIALATALTVRTMRRGMPFALTWWSLTFPVGTFVTGTTQLAVHTGLPAFRVAAVIAYVGPAVHLAAGRYPHRARHPARQPVAPPANTGPVRARKDPVRTPSSPKPTFVASISIGTRQPVDSARARIAVVQIGMTMPVMEPDLDAMCCGGGPEHRRGPVLVAVLG